MNERIESQIAMDAKGCNFVGGLEGCLWTCFSIGSDNAESSDMGR